VFRLNAEIENESAEGMRMFRELESRMQQEVRQAEEDGYARGLRDAQKHPEEREAKETESVEFEFIEFNPRRKARGVEAARVACDGEWLWMSKRDIELNIRDFGPHPELLKALESYK
jgi:hypothetical protein